MLDLNAIVTDLDKLLRRIIGEDIELELRLANDLGLVLADPHQLEQALMNLAVNARDAMPEGGTLAIATASVGLDQAAPGPWTGETGAAAVRLSVTDTGGGMTPDVQERIFEPFYTTKEPGRGTGLGLAMAYGIVKQSGGDMRVVSDPGYGTTFEIDLPVTEAEASSLDEPVVEGQLRGTETVLVVEDELTVRYLARRILAKAGYDVRAVSNGVEALEECDRRGHDIDLLLTDVVMPQMSGKVLADRVTDRFSEMEVLFMSGYVGDAIAQHGVLGEGTSFIAKPFTAPTLLAKVREVLDRRTARDRA